MGTRECSFWKEIKWKRKTRARASVVFILCRAHTTYHLVRLLTNIIKYGKKNSQFSITRVCWSWSSGGKQHTYIYYLIRFFVSLPFCRRSNVLSWALSWWLFCSCLLLLFLISFHSHISRNQCECMCALWLGTAVVVV